MRCSWFILSAVVSLGFLTRVDAEKPFDFATTPGKLPKQVVPEEYAVKIAPDIAKLTFAGSETVKLNVRESVRELVLNACELQIKRGSLDDKPLEQSAFKLDTDRQTLTIATGSELAAGPHVLALEFSGKINQAGQGLYAAPYQEQDSGKKKTMLGTQFEPSDARRFFPCWDEPSFRARFRLTAIVPENFTAVSNMPVESESKKDGAKEVTFAITPSMASYLNVFVAGELDSIEMKSDGVQHRVVATKGKTPMGQYALASSAQILRYYNDYFGVAYPLPKVDQIAVPGGFGGAMENWGGITYYESALLFDPNRSSQKTKQNIFEVIAHETAHQWFGDLVTMAWWDNLWLNEGFASWMGSKCTANFNPDWEVWQRRATPRDPSRRHGIPKEVAMEGDARSTTHPIQQTISTEADANSAFDDITYRKGMSLIRMLESFLGENVFRDGIRKYVAAHKFSNSTTEDLWSALADASGKPVGEIAAAWTQQPGFPIVKVQRAASGKVTLTQERFTVNFPNAQALEWKIPVTYQVVGSPTVESFLMTTKEAALPSAPANSIIKLNAEGAGNYRVQYDDGSWKSLVADIAKLNAPDRVNLLADAWALVQAKRVPLSHYLDLIAKLPPSDDLAEREQLINAFDFIDRLLAGEPQRDDFRKYARSVLRPTFDQLGWEPKSGETARAAALRVSLIDALGNLNDQDIVKGCRERFQKFVANSLSLAPDLRPPMLAVAGRYADDSTANILHELGIKTTSTEEKQNYYDALASALDPKIAARTLEISLGNELPTSRALFLVSRVARQSEHPEVTWEFAKSHMKQLLAKSDALGANSFAPSLFTFFSAGERVAELQSYAKSELPPGAAKDVAKAVDEITFRAELKNRLLRQIPAAFSAHTELR